MTNQHKFMRVIHVIMMGFAFVSVMWLMFTLLEGTLPTEMWNSYPEQLKSAMALILSGAFWLLFAVVRDASDAKNNPEKTDG